MENKNSCCLAAGEVPGQAAQKPGFDITAFGEILIDFTDEGIGNSGAVVFARHPGGAPANVAVGASRLGARSAFQGKTGQDMFGSFLKSVLEAEGVDVSGMIEDENAFTTLAFVSVGADGERNFSFARKPGADLQMRFEDLDLDAICTSRIYHTGSLSLCAEPAKSATLRSIEAARDAGVMISYDPNYRASLWPDEKTAILEMRSLIPFADVMKISDEETELLSGLADPEAAAKALVQRGVKIVCVTLGPDGAIAANREGVCHVEGFPSEVADTNGAGDAFWSAMLTQIAQSGRKAEEISLDTLAQYVRFANAAAALTCRKPGAIPAMPSREEVETLLAGC